LLRGTESDVLSAEVCEQMKRRRPQTEVVEFAGIGHAPALRDAAQIAAIKRWLLQP
jgi:pimeloyl-ACP methyl ester carboxylesterase